MFRVRTRISNLSAYKLFWRIANGRNARLSSGATMSSRKSQMFTRPRIVKNNEKCTILWIIKNKTWCKKTSKNDVTAYGFHRKRVFLKIFISGLKNPRIWFQNGVFKRCVFSFSLIFRVVKPCSKRVYLLGLGEPGCRCTLLRNFNDPPYSFADSSYCFVSTVIVRIFFITLLVERNNKFVTVYVQR